MHLYLIRHADARPVGGSVRSDGDRPLSTHGAADARAVGRVLAAADPGLTLVLTSPLRRAIETGALISAAFHPAPAQRVTEQLAPGFDPEGLMEELLALGSGDHVAVIGHQPDMSTLASRLVTGGTRGSVAFSPGSVAFLSVSPMGRRADAQLRWLLTPGLAALIPAAGEFRRSE
jgi:phosphohistidine phosphatase